VALATADAAPTGFLPPTPYEPGNLEALCHGAYSQRIVDPISTHLVELVLGHASVLRTTDGRRAEAQVQLVTEYPPTAWGDNGRLARRPRDGRDHDGALLLYRAGAWRRRTFDAARLCAELSKHVGSAESLGMCTALKTSARTRATWVPGVVCSVDAVGTNRSTTSLNTSMAAARVSGT
jgi:hypothetical protein